jgi:hypothetical protein
MCIFAIISSCAITLKRGEEAAQIKGTDSQMFIKDSLFQNNPASEQGPKV